MNRLLTPKQVARALQVSEASVKRWCDKGVIPTQKTAGGHRRIPVSGLLDYLRANRRELVRPEVLGLPASSHQRRVQDISLAATPLATSLLSGEEEQCRRIVIDLYLAEHSLSALCDLVLARAFELIGDQWECGAAEVFQERRGCEIALRVLHELRTFVPPPPDDAPRAIGGALEGDQYSLATTMVELVLRDAKWNAVSLGDNLPLDTMAAALRSAKPRLFWLSCSHIADEPSFLAGYRALFDEFSPQVAFVVGGRALTLALRQQMKYAAYCDNLQHLEAFAQTLRSAAIQPTPPVHETPS